MGEIVEVGPAVHNLQVGDRVVVPSFMGCGNCFYCQHEQWSLCDNSNPNAWMAEGILGYPMGGVFGYTHLGGGYAGSFAEYVRVPFADTGPLKVPRDGLTDEQLLFISDAFPTGYMGADFCGIHPGDTVAVWGAGAVGLFAMKSARLLGAEHVIAIDRLPNRLRLAQEHFGAESVINFAEQPDVVEALKELTAGRGPDACIDAVGMEADSPGGDNLYDRAMQTLRIQLERVHVVREAIMACRKGGIVAVIGVYVGFVDKLPLGAAMNKGLTMKTAQQHGQRYAPKLLEHIQRGDVDASRVVSHVLPLSEAQRGYTMFKNKEQNCIRVMLRP
jgi:threonine dehydrogenase-like Zn-dependent dehydrogenase